MILGKAHLTTEFIGTLGNDTLRPSLEDGINEIRVFFRDEKKQDDMND